MSDVPSSTDVAALAGVRVLEIGGTMAAAYAGRLLHDLGAEVLKLEPPAGDPMRHRGPMVAGAASPEASAAAAYFHAGKRSVVVDPAAPESPGLLARLVAGVDVVVVEAAGGWEGVDSETVAAWRAADPRLVAVEISAFGSRGPFADRPATDVTVLAASGFLSVVSSGASGPEPVPIRVPGELSSMFAGCNAVLVALGSLYQRDEHGHGAGLEVSALESIASSLATAYPSVTYAGRVPVHDGTRAVIPWGIYQCTDGEILLQCTEDSQWRKLVRILGDPEWGHIELFETTALRVEQAESVEALVSAAIAEFDADTFLTACRRESVAACRVHNAAEVMAWDHLRGRGFFQALALGGTSIEAPTSPIRVDGRPVVRDRRLHPLGSDTDAVLAALPATLPPSVGGPTPSGARPLEGVRILDLTWVWAGPFSAMQLAHLGADVIKVESAHRMDVTRVLGPFVDEVPGPDRSGYFNQFNQGKRSIALDLSTPQGREVLERLLAEADLVVDNMRAGALSKMGFPQERLQQINQRLVAVTLTGFGETGPERDRPAYGALIDAMSGLNSITGVPGGGPTEIPMSLPDPGSGLHAAIAMVAALRLARATGRGFRVELSMLEAWISCVPWGVLEVAATGRQLAPAGNRDETMVPNGVYRCAGEYEWVAVSARDDGEWARLAQVIERPDLLHDPGYATVEGRRAAVADLDRAVEAWTSARGPIEAEQAFAAVGLPTFHVRRMDEVVECPHLAARGFAPAVEHPVFGARPLPGPPWRSTTWPAGPVGPAPMLGQHTDEVLLRLAGIDTAHLESLREASVLE